jgi:hypothetical protein
MSSQKESDNREEKSEEKEDKYALFLDYLDGNENENAYNQGTHEPIK